LLQLLILWGLVDDVVF